MKLADWSRILSWEGAKRQTSPPLLARAIMVVLALIAVAVTVFPQSLNQMAEKVSRALDPAPKPVERWSLVIACVGSLSGKFAEDNQNLCDAAELRIAKTNAHGGINGYPLVLERFDDQGDPAQAAAIARQLGARGSVIAVIGNFFSRTSIAAGKTYAQYGLPAITATATNPLITRNNPWYFRIIFDDTLQGDLAAIYMHDVLGHDRIAVVGLDDVFLQPLTIEFERKLKSLGAEVPVSVELSDDATAEQIHASVAKISAQPGLDAVFLGLHGAGVKHLMAGLRQAGFTGDILASLGFVGSNQSGGDILSTPSLDQMLLITAYLADLGSVQAHHFESAFLARYGRPASWHAVYGYDSAAAILEALQRTAILQQKGGNWETARLRQGIRDQLQAMDSVRSGTPGLVGPIYFDADGDAPHSIYVGRVEEGQLQAASQQLTLVADSAEVKVMRRSGQNVIDLDDQSLLRITQVLRCGLEFTSAAVIDEAGKIVDIGFDLWLRGDGEFDGGTMTFLDAVEPVVWGQPIRQERVDDAHYQVFGLRGRFHTHPTDEQPMTGNRDLDIRLIDPVRNQIDLILVPDRARMIPSPQQNWWDVLKDRADAVIPPDSGWELVDAELGRDVVSRSTLGSLRTSRAESLYSVFDAHLDFVPQYPFLGEILWFTVSPDCRWSSVNVLVVLLGLSTLPWLRRQCRLSNLLLRLFLASLLLILGGRLALWHFSGEIDHAQFEHLSKAYDSLLFLLPGVWIVALLPRLAWKPIHRKTGYPVPAIARHLVNFVVIGFSVFGVIAYGLDIPLTHVGISGTLLLAALGFVLKSLIQDFFSGLLLSLERPFQVGHWVEVNSRQVGKTFGRVIGLNWRATQILLRDNDIDVIPNSVMTQARLTNRSKPTKASRVQVLVTLDVAVAVSDALRILTQAAQEASNAQGMLMEPAPKAVVDAVGDQGMTYKVQVHHDHDLTSTDGARTATMCAVQHHLRAEGIAFSFPKLQLVGDPSATGGDCAAQSDQPSLGHK